MSKIQNTQLSELLATRLSPAQPASVKSNEFGSLLSQQELKVSGHAQTRLQSRNIELGKDQWDRVLEGVNRAAAKGAKESLVMLDDVAMVVSIKNRTVITAMDKSQLQNNVFTNIDSAVVV